MTNFINLLIFLVNRSGFSVVDQILRALDVQIVSMETLDPANMFKEFATSNHSWAIKFREFANNAFAIDFKVLRHH
jgi:hypothetical protein